MTGGQVDPQLKDLVDCPCGRPECKAFGQVSKATGHVRDCRLGCGVCDSRRRAPRSTRPVSQGVRRQLKARARGQCEASCAPDCTGRGVHAHHVRMRSQGGTDDLANLKWVCRRCHDRIHAEPAEAYDLGLLERTSADGDDHE